MYLFIPGVNYKLILKKINTFFKSKYIGEDIENKSYIFHIIEFVITENTSVKYPKDEYFFPKEFVSKNFIVCEERNDYFLTHT